MLLTVGYAALLFLRRPAGWSDPTIWAEDGRLFLAGTFNPAADVFTIYAGQLWPFQRLVAAGIAQLPTVWWPLALYAVSCAVAAVMISVVLSERARPLLGAFWWRALAAAALVLLPGTWEVQGNLANLHWWATIAAMVLLAMTPARSAVWRWVEIAFLLLVALTGLGGLLLVPIALWRVLTGVRTRAVAIRSVLIFAAAAVNLAIAARYSTRAGASDPLGAWPTMVEFVEVRVGQVLLVGERGLATLNLPAVALTVAAVVLLVLVALLVLTDMRGPSWAWLATGLAAIVLAMASLPEVERPLVLQPYISGRYAVLAMAAVVLIVVRALATGTVFRRVVALVALLMMVPGFAVDAYLNPLGPGVPAAELEAFAACVAEQEQPAGEPFCYVDIQPDTGEWRIVVWRSGVDREAILEQG
ncbi:MAG: hypothetical protein KDC23_04120 [Actinobacteria bacterium]|nr:hypothetical protein [Actinomycetota bacterium]